MPVFKSQQLLGQLKADAQQIINQVLRLQSAGNEVLNRQPEFGKWSIAQVLEHLSFYNNTYIPRLREQLATAGAAKPDFKTGWLGNYFTNMMLPKPDGRVLNKMSAPKEARPPETLDGAQVIRNFISTQQELITLLHIASGKDLGVRVPTSISSIIKLKAGDTFRFLIAHQQRHMTQIAQVAKVIGYDW